MGQEASYTKNTLFFTIALAVAALLLIPIQARATQNEQSVPPDLQHDSVRLLQSDESGITLELSPPEYITTPVETEKGLYQQIRIPGYDYIGLVGQPDLPQKGFLVALPPGAEPVINLVSAENHQVTGVNVAPTVKNTLINIEDDPMSLDYFPDFETSYPFDTAVYDADTNFPANPVTLGQETTLRHQRAVWVIVNPIQVNSVQNTLTVYDQLQIQVTFTFPNGRPEVQTLAPETGDHAALLQTSLLNYEQSINWRTPSETAVMPETSPCMDPNAFRIAVKQTGMYSISYSALAAAQTGFPASIPSQKIRMCYENQQIRIKVNDGSGGTGTFNSGDSIIFYGQSIKTQETDTNIYWLTYSTAGPNGLQMTTASDSAAGSTPAYYIPLNHLENDSRYYSVIPTLDLNDHWYWQEPIVGENANNQLDVEFQMTNKAGGTYSYVVRVEFFGFFFDEDHDFELKMNGTSIGTGSFSGSGIDDNFLIFEANAPSSTLINGTNTLAIIAHDTDNNPSTPGHRLLVNWVEIEPRRQFVAQNSRLAFSQPSAGTYTYNVSSLPNGPVEIFNVSDPINLSIQAKTVTGGNVSFNRTNVSKVDFEVYATNAYLSPSSITKDTIGSGLLGTSSNNADYIIITVPALDSALTPLRNLRSGQGLTNKTVYVQDIFDEFSYGRYATYAIKDFLEYAYNNWNGDRDYVLLAGDGSYDHRNVLGANGNSNLVPVYLRSGVDSTLGEAASDNQYVDFNGDDVADMMLGRIPAQNTTELTTIVNKIIAYETGEANPSWRGKHFFVADNPYLPPGCSLDEAGDFFATVNNFLANHFPDGQILDRLYYAPSGCFPNNSGSYSTIEGYYATSLAEMQTRLLKKFNFGNQFISYTGHSSTQYWGDENYFNISSVPSLTNGNRTPIMLPMTCLEGWYHFNGTTTGLSEALLKRNGGGAVASYGPTGLQVQAGHNYMLDAFYDAIFVNDVQTIGQAIMEAKLNLDSGPETYQDLQDTYMLQGDPAMKFNIPESVTQNFLPVTIKK